MKLRYKILIALVTTPLLSWSYFQGSEYLKGNDYIPYLKKNMQTIEVGNNPEFSILTEDLDEHMLFLVGEIHGFKVPQQLDPELFSYLNSNHDFNTYLLEMDVSQAFFMNRFNESGSDSLLKRVLNTWVVRPGRNNIDYIKRFKKLREVYQNGNGFTYLGTNGISDLELVSQHLSELLPSYSWVLDPTQEENVNLQTLQKQLTSILFSSEVSAISESILIDLKMICKNISYSLKNKYREEVLTQNTFDLYSAYNLKEEKVYGFFGLGHTLKAPLEVGYEAMASRLMREDSWFQKNVLTANFIFTDSHMATTSSALPFYLQDEGPQTRMSVSHDNIWISYLYGIEDLKRLTRAGSTIMFKLNGEDSPYKNSRRLFTMMQLLPMGQLMQAGDQHSTADYTDYVILVRDSDWAEPFPSGNNDSSLAALDG